VMFLHRERETERKNSDERAKSIPTELIIAKQRNGPVGTVDIVFLPSYTKFESLSRAGS
jgi:replicative DNA helicase